MRDEMPVEDAINVENIFGDVLAPSTPSRRSLALLRPIADAAAQERVRDLVLHAYAE